MSIHPIGTQVFQESQHHHGVSGLQFLQPVLQPTLLVVGSMTARPLPCQFKVRLGQIVATYRAVQERRYRHPRWVVPPRFLWHEQARGPVYENMSIRNPRNPTADLAHARHRLRIGVVGGQLDLDVPPIEVLAGRRVRQQNRAL